MIGFIIGLLVGGAAGFALAAFIVVVSEEDKNSTISILG